MFDDARIAETTITQSLFSTARTASWDGRSRRGFTTLTSFGLQALAVGFLLALPLIRPIGLPLPRAVSAPVSLGQPLAVRVTTRSQAGANRTTQSNASDVVWRHPRSIPRSIVSDEGDDGAPALPALGSTAVGTIGGHGLPDGLRDGYGSGPVPIMPAAPRPVAPPLRISHMSEGDLVYRVLPAYPPLARSARVQGTVVLQAIISRQGAIENLRMLSGHSMLVRSAIDAVRQWRYRPYILNGEPVEVETQITVTFSLDGN
ncbi:MAG: energy transducer TonB [Candidatus Sulfotelmatobacter sp.]